MAFGSVNVPGASDAELKELEKKAQEASNKLGTTNDTGGSASAGTVFGKLNKIITDLATHMGRWTGTRAGYIDVIKDNTDRIIEQNNEIKKVNVSHLIWLSDYKIFGEDSYVFQDKDKLHELYQDFALVMNDTWISQEVLAYAEANNMAGTALSCIYGISNKDGLKVLTTMEAVAASETAMAAVATSKRAMEVIAKSENVMAAVIASETAMAAVIASETAMAAVAASETAMEVIAKSENAMAAVLASEIAMAAVITSETAMEAVAASETAMAVVTASETTMNAITTSGEALQRIASSSLPWSALKPFIVKINANDTYIKNVYSVLSNTLYFTKRRSAYIETTNDDDKWLDKFYAAKGFIACHLGALSSNSSTIAKMKINGDLIKSGDLTDAEYVDSNNINAIAIPEVTFYASSSGYATSVAVEVYISNK